MNKLFRIIFIFALIVLALSNCNLADLFGGKEPATKPTTEPTIVDDPVISVDSKNAPATVTIITSTEGAIIYYTADGIDPDPTDIFSTTIQYTAPFTIYKTATIKAIGTKSTLDDSNIITKNLNITPITLKLGDSYDFNGISVKIIQIFWVHSDPYFTSLNNAIGIRVEMVNNRLVDIDYSSMYVWGNLIESTGTQLNSIYYIYGDNTDYFSGSYISPGATIQDSLTFDEYTDSPTSFTFKGKPTFNDGFYFEIIFNLADITTRPSS